MKIKHIWSVISKESIINQDDNLMSIYGILEELTVGINQPQNGEKLPNKIGVPINYEVTSLWFKPKKEEAVKAEIRFKLIGPGEEELTNAVQSMEIPENVRRFRSRMKIAGFPITKEGDYFMEVSIKEEGEKSFKRLSKLPIEIKIKIEST